MRGQLWSNKVAVRSWIRRVGKHFTTKEASKLWGIPEKTLRDWYWECDCAPKNCPDTVPQDIGLSQIMLRKPFTAAGGVCRDLRRERKAYQRALSAHA